MVHYVVIGGGVAGIACVQELLRFLTLPATSSSSIVNNSVSSSPSYSTAISSSPSLSSSSSVTLISASSTIKGIKNYVKVSDNLETFDIEDKTLASLQEEYGTTMLHIIHGIVTNITVPSSQLIIQLSTPDNFINDINYPTMVKTITLSYDKLCICTGAAPRLIIPNHPLIFGLRDTLSIEYLARYIQNQNIQRIGIIGNGGIALGLVYELSTLNKHLLQTSKLSNISPIQIPEILWGIKDSYIGNTFFDASASQFFLSDPELGIEIIYPEQHNTDSHSVPSLSSSSSLLSPIETGYTETVPMDNETTISDQLLTQSLTEMNVLESGIKGKGSLPVSESSSKAYASNTATGGSFIPLPQRIRRKRGRQDVGQPSTDIDTKNLLLTDTNINSQNQEEIATKSNNTLENESSINNTNHTTSTTKVSYGSSLGPSWVSTLREWLTNSTTDNTILQLQEHSPRHDKSSINTTVVNTLPTNTRIILETEVEITAIRGTGVSGAVEKLSDEQWHTIQELQSSINTQESSIIIPTPSVNHDNDNFPLHIQFSNNHRYGVDLIISATGVSPVIQMLPYVQPIASAPSILTLSPTLSTEYFNKESIFYVHADGGLIVNRHMQTTGSPNIYAAGDVASILWPRIMHHHHISENHTTIHQPSVWFQMRLWNQARIEGVYTARSMLNTLDPLEIDDGGMTFEIFAHMTKFLNKKVVLLGLFNGQGLGTDYELALRTSLITSYGIQNNKLINELTEISTDKSEKKQIYKTNNKRSPVQIQLRITPGQEYCKIIILHGKVVGAMLIGDTDLEETMEHLILNQLDIRKKKLLPHHYNTYRRNSDTNIPNDTMEEENEDEDDEPLDLLDPTIDIEDYFD